MKDSTRSGLITVAVPAPTDPVIAPTYPLAPQSWAEGLAVSEGLIYLAVGDKRGGEEDGLHILDAHSPCAISGTGNLSFSDWVEGVHAAGDIAYVANTFSGARSIDVRHPDSPLLVDSLTLERWSTRHPRSALGRIDRCRPGIESVVRLATEWSAVRLHFAMGRCR